MDSYDTTTETYLPKRCLTADTRETERRTSRTKALERYQAEDKQGDV